MPQRRLPWGAWRQGRRDAVALWAANAYIEDLARRRRAGGASGSAGTSGSAAAWAAVRERRVWATPLAVAMSLSEHAECNMTPPREAPRTPLAQAELADDDIGVGDELRAVVADILLGDDDAHWASFIPAWKSPPRFYGGPPDSPPACRDADASRPIVAPCCEVNDGRIGLQEGSDGPDESRTDISSFWGYPLSRTSSAVGFGRERRSSGGA